MNQVKDIMQVNPICCLPSSSLKVVAKLMLIHECSEIPVVYSIERPKIVGVITEKDIVRRVIAQGLNPLEMTAQETMSIPAIVINMHMSIDDCCLIMEEEEVSFAPVVDDEENCCGIVTLADITLMSDIYITAVTLDDILKPSYQDSPIEVS